MPLHAGLMPLLAVAALAASVDRPATDTGRFVFRDAKIAGETHRYAVWLPPGYGASRPWPAIVFLHGSGECGDDGVKPTRVGFGPALEAHPGRWPFVVLFPQKPGEFEEWEERENLVFAILGQATKHFALDRHRMALAGLSQGGHGVWMIGARHPERWACLVPICGYGRGRTIAPRIARLPVWAFHGLRDDVVDPADTRHIVEWTRNERTRLGLDPLGAHMTLFPEANHNSWDAAFASDSLNAWLRDRLSER